MYYGQLENRECVINSVLKLPRKEAESAISEDFWAAELYKNRVFFSFKNLEGKFTS